MKKFYYRLEKLLEIKAHNERSKSLELAEVTGRLIKTGEEIKNLKDMKKQVLFSRYAGEEKQAAATSMLEYAENQISAIKSRISKLEKMLEQIKGEHEKARNVYVGALKEKKVLEKLKEKKQFMHVKNEYNREARVLEDIVITSFTVKTREG